MDPVIIELFEPAIVFATLLGTAFCVKLLVWGKGPIKQIRRQRGSSDLDQRMLTRGSPERPPALESREPATPV